MTDRAAWGYGLVTVARATVLDAWFPHPQLGTLPVGTDPYIAPAEFEELTGADERRRVELEFRTVVIDLDAAPESTPDAYLRLHLLSHRLAEPNSINLDGIFAQLPVVAWTNAGPVHPDDFAEFQQLLLRAGITAHSLDKFPRLLDYVVPPRVRIADASRVRLGAYLSPGTTVMHEGFVNFNAGDARVLDGGGPHLAGCRGRRRCGHRGRRIHHGHPLRRRYRTGLDREARAARRERGVGISIGDDTVVEAGL